MPFKQEIIQLKEVEIHLMYFKDYNPKDYLDHLTDLEKERFFSFKSIKRQQEFVATRILRHKIFGFQHIHYDKNGAPFIDKEGFISISHAQGVVGIALSKEYRIGLDLELRQDKALRLKTKILSSQEWNQLDIDSEDEMTKVWSAKEVLYKLAGRKEIHFKTDLHLEKKSEYWTGRIINPQETIFVDLSIFVKDNIIISINTSPCRHEQYSI